jgi:cobalt/nickel transport system permease protein
MIPLAPFPLWAVHIDDGILSAPWAAGGFVLAALLALWGAWGIRDEEIPRVALMGAVFFVASLIPIPVPAAGHTHLLLNGLLGVVLGRRAFLAVPVGLFLQAALFGHGGFTALGVNSCVMGLPALVAWLLFAGLRRLPVVRRPWFRALLVAASSLVLTLSLVYSISLLCSNRLTQIDTLETAWANRITFHPLTLAAALLLAGMAAWAERLLENAPEFPLGLLVGETAVLATICLNSVALIWGAQVDLHTQALVMCVVHLPLAVVEGVVLGFTVGFLVRVKPEMLRWPVAEKAECAVDSLP